MSTPSAGIARDSVRVPASLPLCLPFTCACWLPLFHAQSLVLATYYSSLERLGRIGIGTWHAGISGRAVSATCARKCHEQHSTGPGQHRGGPRSRLPGQPPGGACARGPQLALPVDGAVNGVCRLQRAHTLLVLLAAVATVSSLARRPGGRGTRGTDPPWWLCMRDPCWAARRGSGRGL